MERIEKFIRTREDWHPSFGPHESGNPFPEPALRVAAIPLRSPAPNWRVCVWGNDDFGMERDELTQPEAKEVFDSIADHTTIEQFRALGFQFA